MACFNARWVGENIHRLDLTQVQLDRVMTAKATTEKGAPKAQVSAGGRGKKGGKSDAARQAGYT